jgi:transposase
VTLLTRWLPDVSLLPLDAWHMDDPTTQRTWRVTSTQALVHCPVCRFPRRRLHSRDVRTVADLPGGPWHVVRDRRVRQCFCANGRCTRRMFTARPAPLVAPWARRTQRLAHGLVPIALARAGRAGARLRCALGRAVSRHTLLHRLRRLPLPAVAPPTGSAWRIGPIASARPLGPCGSTSTGGDRSLSGPLVSPRPSPAGDRPIPASA